ncbi:MAG TPA: LCP family protein [Acidimicrobiales bacterium]|nr:LCP family protein [Acidimicrobiales bacterium]
MSDRAGRGRGPVRGRKGSAANESGLWALGDRMDGVAPATGPRPEPAPAPPASSSRRAGSIANESGLRALGDRMNGVAPAPAAAPAAAIPGQPERERPTSSRRTATIANESGLRALEARMRHLEAGPVANQSGLLALGEEMERRRSLAGTNGRTATLASAPVDAATGLPSIGEALPDVRADGAELPNPQALVDDPHPSRRHRHARARSRTRTWVRRSALIAAALLLVVVGGGGGYLYYLTHDLKRQDVRGLQGALTSGKEAGTENILMVGSTSRCALSVQNAAYGLCDEGVNGVNSDVMMILHVDPTHHRLALLSIPRDLFVPNARAEGANKIDAGLFEGVSQVVASIEEDFGIPIQHTVTLNFDQFANVVDALGGINMSFPMSVFDAESGLNVQAAACVHLDGTQALSVVRARHLQYQLPTTVSDDAFYWPQENLSDLARIRRDHEFLRVLATTAAQKGLGNPITDLDLINSVKADLTFDEDWSVTDMADLVVDFHATNANSVPQLTLPVSDVVDPDGGSGGDLIYRGSDYGEAEFPAESQDQAVVDQVLGIGALTDSMTGNPLPAPATVAVSVVDGTGTGDAPATATAFGALGFHVVGTSAQEAAGDVTETVVYYGSRAPATEAAAEAVERSMTGAVIMAFDPSEVAPGSEVTVVTGTDFAVDSPPAPPTTTAPTAPGGGSVATVPATTAAPAPATTSPQNAQVADGTIQPPSPATSALAPWDPRACAPGAVPTAPVANET